MTSVATTAPASAPSYELTTDDRLAHYFCPLCVEERLLTGGNVRPMVALCGYVKPADEPPTDSAGRTVCPDCAEIRRDDRAVVRAFTARPCFVYGQHRPAELPLPVGGVN